MKYLHTMVRVRNLEESLKFYCDILGLEEVRRKDVPEGKFTLVFLASKEDIETNSENPPTLELTYNYPDEHGNVEEYNGGRNFGHLAYRVNNIYGFCQMLMDKGVIINRPPRDGHMAFIKSPDGISIELIQKGSSLPSQEPWASMQNVGTW